MPYRGSCGAGVRGCPIGGLRGRDVPPPAPKQRSGDPLKWGTQCRSMYSPMGGGVGLGVRGCPIGGLKCPIESLKCPIGS